MNTPEAHDFVDTLSDKECYEIVTYAAGYDSHGDWHFCIPERLREALHRAAMSQI